MDSCCLHKGMNLAFWTWKTMIWLKRKSYLNSIKILPLPVSTNFMTPNPKIFVARELLFIAPFLARTAGEPRSLHNIHTYRRRRTTSEDMVYL